MFVFQNKNKKRPFFVKIYQKLKKTFSTLQTTVWMFWFSCGTAHVVDGRTDPVSCVIQRSAASPFLLSFSGNTEPPGDDRITLVAQQEHRQTVVKSLPQFGPERSHLRFFQGPRYPFHFCVDT